MSAQDYAGLLGRIKNNNTAVVWQKGSDHFSEKRDLHCYSTKILLSSKMDVPAFVISRQNNNESSCSPQAVVAQPSAQRQSGRHREALGIGLQITNRHSLHI